MIVMTMMEMEHHTKSRYNFAMSSFSRMYGVNAINGSTSISKFCYEWANNEKNNVPLGSLTQVDFYFRDLWQSK